MPQPREWIWFRPFSDERALGCKYGVWVVLKIQGKWMDIFDGEISNLRGGGCYTLPEVTLRATEVEGAILVKWILSPSLTSWCSPLAIGQCLVA
jgi:hypothetical protein